MTYRTRKPSPTRTARPAETFARDPFVHAAPTAIAAARATTTLALSMTVALRYLKGREARPAAAAVPHPVLP